MENTDLTFQTLGDQAHPSALDGISYKIMDMESNLGGGTEMIEAMAHIVILYKCSSSYMTNLAAVWSPKIIISAKAINTIPGA